MFEPPTDEVGITQHHLAAENVTASPFELVPNQSNTGAREPYRRLPRVLEPRGLGDCCSEYYTRREECLCLHAPPELCCNKSYARLVSAHLLVPPDDCCNEELHETLVCASPCSTRALL